MSQTTRKYIDSGRAREHQRRKRRWMEKRSCNWCSTTVGVNSELCSDCERLRHRGDRLWKSLAEHDQSYIKSKERSIVDFIL
jgi:hypothetical protein